MSNSRGVDEAAAHGPRPTPPQLAHLRRLAGRCGCTFAWPQTVGQASREIERLEALERMLRSDRRREDKTVRDAVASGPSDAAAVREDEVVGFGSSARWA
jgi:hypothetical protein